MSHPQNHSDPRPGVAADNYLAGKHEVRRVLNFAIILVVSLAVVFVAMYVLLGVFAKQHDLADLPENPFHNAQRLPPEPRVSPNEVQLLRGNRQREREALETYGWVDRPAGVVHVPIDKAMEIWLRQQGVAGPTTREAKP